MALWTHIPALAGLCSFWGLQGRGSLPASPAPRGQQAPFLHPEGQWGVPTHQSPELHPSLTKAGKVSPRVGPLCLEWAHLAVQASLCISRSSA